jgi:hypothetical protein
VPRIGDFLQVILDELLRLVEDMGRKARLRCQLNIRSQPKLGLTVRMGNMDVDPLLLTGEEKESKLAVPEYRGSHGTSVGTILRSESNILLETSQEILAVLVPGRRRCHGFPCPAADAAKWSQKTTAGERIKSSEQSAPRLAR